MMHCKLSWTCLSPQSGQFLVVILEKNIFHWRFFRMVTSVEAESSMTIGAVAVIGHATWLPFLGLLPWYPVTRPSPRNSFQDLAMQIGYIHTQHRYHHESLLDLLSLKHTQILTKYRQMSCGINEKWDVFEYYHALCSNFIILYEGGWWCWADFTAFRRRFRKICWCNVSSDHYYNVT